MVRVIGDPKMRGKVLLLLALLAATVMLAFNQVGVAYSQNCNNFGCTTTLLFTIAPVTISSTTVPITAITAVKQTHTMISETTNIAANSPVIIAIPNANATLRIFTNSTYPQAINVMIANYTEGTGLPSMVAGYEQLAVFNTSITTKAHVTANLTYAYPCSISELLIYPAIVVGGAWAPQSNVTANLGACSLNVPVSGKTVLGFFLKVPVSTAYTVVTYPTVQISNISQGGNWAGVAAVVVVLVIILAGIYYNYRKNTRPPGVNLPKMHPVQAKRLKTQQRKPQHKQKPGEES